MKNLAFTVTLMLCILTVHSQDLKQVTKYSDFLINKYTIDKSTKRKEGPFVQLERKTKDTICVGYYKNDKKVEVWHYYDNNNELYFSYNHDSNKIVHKSQLLIQTDSFLVKKEGDFVLEKVDSPPVLLEGKNYALKIFAERFKLPISILQNEISGRCIYSVEIKKDGAIGGVNAVYSLDKTVDFEVERIFKLLKDDEVRFSPAKIGADTFDSEYLLTIYIQPGLGGNTASKVPYLWEISFSYFISVRTETRRETRKF